MTSSPPDPPRDTLTHVSDSVRRVVRAVDAMGEGDWHGPSLLPGWTRAHVVAHLTLNGEGMARVLHSMVGEGEPLPMYDSVDQRDDDIAALGTADPAEIRERFLASTTIFADAAAAVPDAAWEGTFDRAPGGRTTARARIPALRWAELEFHHADLGVGYTADDWALDFAEHELRALADRHDPQEAFEIRPTDSDEVYSVGASGGAHVAIVTGPSAQLAWWLSGRAASATISSSRGDLPTIGA